MEDVRNLFHVLNRRFSLLQKNGFREEGIDISLIHSHILFEIDKHTQPSMQQLADLLGIDITTFSRQIQTLVKANLVKKRAKQEDKRVYVLSLTQKGKQTADQIDTIINTHLERVFLKLNDFEKDTIIHSLKIVTKAMGEVRNGNMIKG
ncbi:MarR family transcriptional regulator [Fictibacillus nanhaiensis]|uniref:MarR family winged helix-turn-helix transcriptional regulator n=1 Tax=Fictibacillus nanhaiensis TaxID=742169 RepID=UPI001C988048|nr:MarR family transcriptional regulator [Fictibacillus nanhaiensis]MBY6037808.1 MarR family transcriptional regulator [Fictibacillus nanhaiensis]